MRKLLFFALFASVAYAQRIPQINLYTGDPTGVTCTKNYALVQSTTTGSIYACTGGVYVSTASAAGYPGVTPDGSNGLGVTGGVVANAATIGTINGVLDVGACALTSKPSWCGSTANVGAWINGAVTQLGSQGLITVPPGTYSFGTQIVKPRKIILRGAGTNATILNWTGTGNPILVQDSAGGESTVMFEGGLSDFRLTTTTNTNDGIYWGCQFGAGTSGTGCGTGGSNHSLWGDHQSVWNVEIDGFATAEVYGSNAFFITHYNVNESNNTVSYGTDSAGTANSGEQIMYYGGAMQNATQGCNTWPLSTPVKFFGTSADFISNATTPAFSGCPVEIHGGHWESFVGTFFSGSILRMFGGEVLLDQASGTTASIIKFSGSGGATVVIDGTNFFAATGQTVTELIDDESTGTKDISITNITGNFNHSIQALFQSGYTDYMTNTGICVSSRLIFLTGTWCGDTLNLNRTLTVTNGGTASRSMQQWTDTSASAGSTPSKFLRMNAGDLQLTANDGTVIFDLSDSGILSHITSYSIGTTPRLYLSGGSMYLDGGGTTSLILTPDAGTHSIFIGTTNGISSGPGANFGPHSINTNVGYAIGGVAGVSATGVVCTNVTSGLCVATQTVHYSTSWTPIAVTASTCSEQTVTVTGATTSKAVSVSPPGSMAHVWISHGRVTAADTVAVQFCADSTGGTPPSGTWLFTIQ